MQLFPMWKNSLKIFIPRNFKLFGLVSLNAAYQACVVWFKLFWPLFILNVVAGLLFFCCAQTAAFLEALSKFALFTTLILSLRPSMKRKTYAYFCDYYWHIGLMAVVFFADFFIAVEHGEQPILASYLFSPLFLLTLAIFLFFYFDTTGHVRDFLLSCWRALKMLWYGLPFYLVVLVATGLCFFVISECLWLLFPGLAYLFRTVPLNVFYGFFYAMFVKLVLIMFSVIPVAFVSVFYTKKVHDNPDDFFDSPAA